MCGIAGIWTKNKRSGAEMVAMCLQFSRSLQHRGPDDEGFVLFTTDGKAEAYRGDQSDSGIDLPHISTASGSYKAALVHRRLSIISPGPEGHQPMVSHDRNCWISYNGETFNYRDLDSQFGIANRSNNDAETALELMSEGAQNHARLDGFHAMAVYDAVHQKLALYRDATGVKPLFYFKDDSVFAFASESRALQKLGNFNQVNPKAVFHLLAEGIIIPNTPLISEIQEVPYELFFNELNFEITVNPVVEKPVVHHRGWDLEHEITRSIQTRLMSDVPLGFAVSGGLDSAIIIGAARKILGPKANLKLFSVISDDKKSDERKWQEKVAHWNQAEWHTVNASGFHSALLPEVVKATGLPPVAWNNIAQFELARLAKSNGVTVLFNGQGADEIFCGYTDYLVRYFGQNPGFVFRHRRRMPQTIQSLILDFIKLKWKGRLSELSKKKQFFKRTEGWLSEEFSDYAPYLWQFANDSAEAKMKTDYYGQKLRQMLTWEDINGMSHQLESRNPFADDSMFADWLNVPLKRRLMGGYSKGILRHAARHLVPKDVLWRRDKKGFTVPDSWLTWQSVNEWEEAFMSSRLDSISPRTKRENALRQLRQNNKRDLQWYFRIASLSYYLENLQGEKK